MRKLGLAIATLAAAAMTVTPVLAATELTVFNSKSEIQTQFEEEATAYSDAAGVDMTVTMSNDPVITHMGTKYSSNDPYVLSMVDAKDIYTLTPEHGIDLADLEAVADTDYAIEIDGKVAAVPFCVEARGVMYNKTAIEEITGEEFVPEDYATLDAFKELLDKLVEGGMEAPVAIMSEDWSLGAHYLAQWIEEQEDPEAYVQALCAGEGDIINNEKFNSLMDTFDVLMEYNYAKDAAATADRNTSEDMLAWGDVAFMFGGNWDWSLIVQSESDSEMGMMPGPQNTDDGTNGKLVGGGSKYFFIDNSVSEEQQQAAKDFLNWMATDPEGQDFVTNTCALVSPYKSNTLDVADPLSVCVKAYADAGNLINNYNFLPDDHYTSCGATMQKYLGGKIDRQGLADELTEYWKSATPIEH
ncbi:MAG: extracellular solute-binding protein [Lachnospiraceae bacterium]|nr:extracellular solute-binding protein [Lachnospiraceae bacterium]